MVDWRAGTLRDSEMLVDRVYWIVAQGTTLYLLETDS